MSRCRAIALLLTAALAGCTANPYVTREVQDESGEVVEKVFAYGKFCGPEHPVLFEDDENGGVETDLFALWPPVDDIDAACFAHDYCHQAMHPRTNQCDAALASTMMDFMDDFPDHGCYNLAFDIWAIIRETHSELPGFFQKIEQAINVSTAATSDPFLKAMTKRTDDYPAEGDCRLVPLGSTEMLLDAFEYFFAINQEAFRKNRELKIPRNH